MPRVRISSIFFCFIWKVLIEIVFLDVKIAIIEPKDVQEPQEVQGAQIQGKKAPRDQWSKDIEFLLASIGYCVGVGNIWR